MISEYRLIRQRNSYRPDLQIVKQINDNPQLPDKEMLSWLCCEYALDDIPVEQAWVIGYNYNAEIVGYMQLALGNCQEVVTVQKEMMTALLLMGAEQFTIVHNHPSGNEEPSLGDWTVFTQCEKLASLFNLTFLDSLIVLGNQQCGKYVSMRDKKVYDLY